MPARRDADWVRDLDHHLTSLSRLLRSPGLHAQVSRRAGVDIGEHLQLTLAHIRAGEPVRVLDLAGTLGLERSTTSRRVTALVDAGLVERTADPQDARAAALRLTPAGEQVVDAVQQAWLGLLTELTRGWPPRRREDTLRRVRDLDDGLHALTAPPA